MLYLLLTVAPQAGFEPATLRLTAGCSTIELLWNMERMSESMAKISLKLSLFAVTTIDNVKKIA